MNEGVNHCKIFAIFFILIHTIYAEAEPKIWYNRDRLNKQIKLLMMEEKSQRKKMKNFAQNFLYFGFFLAFVALGIVGYLKYSVAASPPSIVTYQGKLIEGGVVVSTTKQMYFVLYNQSAGGVGLYTASGTIGAENFIDVSPVAGLFSVNLGDTGTNVLDSAIFQNNSEVYLEVRIGGQTLSPRKRITASPFAINSKYLNGVEASSTAPASVYIPLSDSSGNFEFNFVSSTGLSVVGDAVVSGNVTSTGYIVSQTSFRSNQYCDVNGLHCFNPSTSGWGGVASQIRTTTWTTAGNFSHGGKVGYQAANDACESEFTGSHFCFSGEIIRIIATEDISYFSGNAWIAEGPPGFTANSNDCNGYVSSNNAFLGAFWVFNPAGGGAGWLTACNGIKPISCCL